MFFTLSLYRNYLKTDLIKNMVKKIIKTEIIILPSKMLQI